MLRPLLCAIALTAALPAFAQLSGAERKIAAAVDADSAGTLTLLERMVNQNSGTLNLAGVRAMGEMLRPEFEALGFKVMWIDLPETQRAGHFVATHKGDGRGKRVLLIAHIDT